MTKTAMILCAGRGIRLTPFTNNKPKPLVEVNGISILENSIQQLINAGYQNLSIVVGYKGDMIKEIVSKYSSQLDIHIIENNEWSTSNNIMSLWKARNELQGDITLLEGDVFYDESVLKQLNDMPLGANYLVVSPLTSFMDGMYVTEEAGKISGFYNTSKKTHQHGKEPLKSVNICRLSTNICQYLVESIQKEVAAGNMHRFYDDLFEDAFRLGYEFRVVKVDTKSWFEVDNPYDLSLCEFQHSRDPYQRLKQQHGGYWRHPITDFALIYNLHFPPKTLKEKIKDRFDEIILNYPASSVPIIRHLSYFLGVNDDKLAIANGVSEIIKLLPRFIKGNIVLVEPSFNEYANCFTDERITTFQLKEKDDFQLNIYDLIECILHNDAQAVILETPNNPTGRLVKKEDIIKLYEATEQHNILVVLDESFIDFSCRETTEQLLHDLHLYPRILLFRSMSKTFGIGGLRIGYAVSSNLYMIKELRSELPIWNINGFAEEFLLNLPPYREEYFRSCKVVRRETDNLLDALRQIDGIKAFDTEANFIFCKIQNKLFTAEQLAHKLVRKYGVYIKECSGKKLPDSEYFFRVSSRTDSENEQLIHALSTIFEREYDYTT
ncbi:aminotransferase class I/II-fold pyridoxal phosphate-dependent enzyme [Paenibacillus alvei]|uniref:aminotransferase class I/II-fold pyridoxal phosphate-dependent enzyme n=1 Tax=Paenibacillus alvei TaxID=44250 RepID=UPI00227EB024|nr:aminotransferase class I/II-fold pyridoxal phosphate-dependent enzyme [Paenibacillus alvei]